MSVGKHETKVTVVCPLYNAEEFLWKFNESLVFQAGVKIVEVKYILTESSDKTSEILDKILTEKKLNVEITRLKKSEFSHSLSREKAGMNAKGEVIVFLTQDVEIRDKEFLKKLVEPIVSGEVSAAYARQKAKHDNIEKYTRQYNYPARAKVVSANDIEKLGLKTFFFSDAAGAVSTEMFKRVKGYDGKDLPISEDMYLAHKLIVCGEKIKYVADAVCYHSHKFSLKELYERYKKTGEFFKQNPEIAKYGQLKAGGGMAKYVLVHALSDWNFKVLLQFLPNMIVRFVGMRRGM